MNDQNYYDHRRLWRDEYGLPGLLCNCLYQMNVHTLEDAAALSDYELLKQPNLGRKSLKVLRQFLAEKRVTPPIKATPGESNEDTGVLVLYLDEKTNARLKHYAKVNDRNVADEALALLRLAIRQIKAVDEYIK